MTGDKRAQRARAAGLTWNQAFCVLHTLFLGPVVSGHLSWRPSTLAHTWSFQDLETRLINPIRVSLLLQGDPSMDEGAVGEKNQGNQTQSSKSQYQ